MHSVLLHSGASSRIIHVDDGNVWEGSKAKAALCLLKFWECHASKIRQAASIAESASADCLKVEFGFDTYFICIV